MSQLKVNSIVDASGGNTAQINGATPTAYNTMGRNRIINGDMRIDQRNAGAAVTPTSGGYTLDRFTYQLSQASKATIQQNAGSVTPPTGFSNYLGVTSTSAYSSGSSDFFRIYQPIEGYNVADLAWGTASAKTVTLSFWVRSSLTGTFGGALQNSASNRSYPFTYTISSANTWEQKSITIAGDTSGTWLTTNGTGIVVGFNLGTGTTFSGTANAWAGANYLSATGATSVLATNGATWYITGVQLEVGSVATEFERRPYGTELALCMRYYEKSYKIGTVPGTSTNDGAQAGGGSTEDSGGYYATIRFLVSKRTAPSMTGYATDGTSGSFFRKSSGVAAGTSAVVFDLQSENSTRFYVTPPFSNWVAAYVAGHWVASAEL